MLTKLIALIFKFGPLVFGFGFLVPLFRELMIVSGVALPFGMSALVAALILGGGLGLIAQVRGSWIWQK